jgi:hypothetical protein
MSSSIGALQCDSCDDGTFADISGSSECLACGSPTESSSDHTKCELDCTTVTFGQNVYDLSALGPIRFTYAPNVNITINVRGDLCQWSSGCPNQNSYLCVDDDNILNANPSLTNDWTSLGKVIEFTERTVGDQPGLLVELRHGTAV